MRIGGRHSRERDQGGRATWPKTRVRRTVSRTSTWSSSGPASPGCTCSTGCGSWGSRRAVLEAADDVGGTWYWNRYPGARCDIPTIDYSYSFDPELEREWTVVGEVRDAARDPPLPAVRRRQARPAPRHPTSRPASTPATWDEAASRWRRAHRSRRRALVPLLRDGDRAACRCRRSPTSRAPTASAARCTSPAAGRTRASTSPGKRVAVIGTGSSGIQSIPLIAAQAAQLTVFQRTPNFSRAGPQRSGRRRSGSPRSTPTAPRTARPRSARVAASPCEPPELTAAMCSEEERRARFEEAYAAGELLASSASSPTGGEPRGQRDRGRVHPRRRSARSCAIRRRPRRSARRTTSSAPSGRASTPSYFETFNLPHVRLVDLRKDPIRTITETGIDTASESFEFDAIVFATGFDAMTGALVVGRHRRSRRRHAEAEVGRRPETYLGLMTVGFPNFFTITGPGQPVGAVEHGRCRSSSTSTGSPTGSPTCATQRLRDDRADAGRPRPAGCSTSTTAPTSRSSRTANSWYMGANVPGKPRVFLPYIGGVDAYRDDLRRGRRRGLPRLPPRRPGRRAVQRRRHPPAAARRRASCST